MQTKSKFNFLYPAILLMFNSIILSLFLSAFAASIVGAYFQSITLTLLFYILLLSKYGESFLRKLEGIRPLYTSRLTEHLEPLFEEVIFSLNKRHLTRETKTIKLYVIDNLQVNAFALGLNTVALTRGAINGMSDTAIKGLIAHELGHLIHGDTINSVIIRFGNIVYFCVVRLFCFLLDIMEKRSARENEKGVAYIAGNIIGSLFKSVKMIYEGVQKLILAYVSRQQELRADRFAYDLGYGEELIEALYIFDDMSANDKETFKGSFMASHPHVAKRIHILESL